MTSGEPTLQVRNFSADFVSVWEEERPPLRRAVNLRLRKIVEANTKAGMMRISNLVPKIFVGAALAMVPAASFAAVFVSVNIAPPVLPVYTQPVCPGDDICGIRDIGLTGLKATTGFRVSG